MRLAPLLIALAAAAAVGAAWLVLRPDAETGVVPTPLDADRESDAPARSATPRRDRVQPPPRGTPLDEAARELLARARELVVNGRTLDALVLLVPPRVEDAGWLPPVAEEIAGWEDAVLDGLEGDAAAGRTIPDRVLGRATRALLLAESKARLRRLLEQIGAATRAAEAGLLEGFVVTAESDAIARHLDRFGRARNRPEGHALDTQLMRVGEREWPARVAPLPVADPAAVEDRRIAQLERLRNRGVTSALERIAAGLAWLALHQSDDGSLRDTALRCAKLHGDGEVCGRDRKRSHRALAATSLAALAFLDFRDQDARGLFEPSLARAIAWIRRQQRQDGGFGREGYDAALALLALGQAAAASGDAGIGADTERAWRSYEQTAGPRGGYRYIAKQDGDLSVTAWVVQAVEAAQAAGLDAPSAETVEALRYFVRTTWDGRAGFVYRIGERPRPSLQSAGMLALHILGEADEDAVRERFASTLAATATQAERGQRFNLYRLYYDVRVELLLSDDLTAWRRDRVLRYAASFQRDEGFEAGLFDPEPATTGDSAPREQWVSRGGLEAFHAFSVLTLEHTLFRR